MQLISLVYFNSGSYANQDSLDQFDAYSVGNMTPQAVFSGDTNPGSMVIGGGEQHISKYEERIKGLLSQKSGVFLNALESGVVTVGGHIAVNVFLTNTSKDVILNSTLYAVIYNKANNIVMGVTPVKAIPSFASGASLNFQFPDDKLSNLPGYGVAVIMKASSGLIIQAFKLK